MEPSKKYNLRNRFPSDGGKVTVETLLSKKRRKVREKKDSNYRPQKRKRLDSPIPSESSEEDSEDSGSSSESPESSEGIGDSSESSEEESGNSSEDPEASSESDEDFIDNSEEYFKLDPSPLVNVILKRLTKKFPDLPEEGLHSSILKAIERAQEDIVGEYLGATPRDERWKTKMDEEEVEKLEPQLKAIREEIEKKKPTLKRILEANIMSSQKKKAVEMYDILGNTEPFTHEFRGTQKIIMEILEDEEDDPAKIKKYEEVDSRLKAKSGNILSRLKKKIFDLNTSEEVKTRIYELYVRMEDLSPGSEERASLREKIMWAVSLPHQNVVLPETRLSGSSLHHKAEYCAKVYNSLESKLYGMRLVKERLIQILNNRLMNPGTKSMLALKGPPGVGKSAVAKALADSVGLPFEKISLGGLEDPGMLTGQDNSWIGSTPSILLQILRRMKCCNGIVLFDELDKLSDTSRGKSVQNVLLHITDYLQNKEFQDSYLYEFPHDLSQIWFMFAMNESKSLDSALRDRLDIITLEKYRHTEMVTIIQRHILPGVLKDIGFSEGSITISEQACGTVLNLLAPQMKDSGLRAVEKELHRMLSRISFFYTNLHSPNKIELSYKLPEFKGFPHLITGSEIHDLWSDPKTNLDYLRMYG